MIVLRAVAHGVKEHFKARKSEWLMLFPCGGMGAVLNLQSNMFELSNSFNELARRYEEKEWAFFIIMAAAVRMFALTVNGTFESFPYSPHLRMFASACSGYFWLQFTMGFAYTGQEGIGAWSAIVAYGSFVVFECANIVQSSYDLKPGRKKKGQ